MSAVEKEPGEAANTRFAKDQLKAFVERIERLEEEKKTISDDIRDVYAESKGNGFDVKALRAAITGALANPTLPHVMRPPYKLVKARQKLVEGGVMKRPPGVADEQ